MPSHAEVLRVGPAFAWHGVFPDIAPRRRTVRSVVQWRLRGWPDDWSAGVALRGWIFAAIVGVSGPVLVRTALLEMNT